MHSVQIPDLFEEEFNLVPTHTVGLNIHGRVPILGQNFKYVVGLGNGRSMTPTANVLARDRVGKEITALLEWEVPGIEDFVVGISGWTDVIRTTQAESGERAIRLVGSLKGGLGFVFEESLTEDARKKVKIVLTVGAD